MDEDGSFHIVDNGKCEVRRYGRRKSEGTVVAGANGNGNRLDRLSDTRYVFVDRDHSVYVFDCGNDHVMKYTKDAKQGILVASGQGQGNGLIYNCHAFKESLLINWALCMWLIVGMLESCLARKEPHKGM